MPDHRRSDDDDMDPLQLKEGRRGERKALRILFRCCFTIAFSLLASFFLGLVSIAVGVFSSSSPVSVPTACRIISSSVDLRSAKVCELGMLNYKAKNVFYSSENTRFRCRDDYYWASVFEVEYQDFFSGQILHAVAEAPKEALPHDCRPSFSTAWSTKLRFKVNETYNCRYIIGSLKADIYPENLFNCQSKDPSTAEMIRRFCILLTKPSSLDKGNSSRRMASAASGVVSGMLVAMCLIILIKILRISAIAVAKQCQNYRFRAAAYRFRRACLLVAYVSAVGWLVLQYAEMVGLKQLILDSKLGHKVTHLPP